MTFLQRMLKVIDYTSEVSGAIGKWFALLLVLVGSFETVARHFFNDPTIWAYDTLCMSGGALYMLGASWVFKNDAHTRVDLFYSRFSRKGKAIMDIICSMVLFFPLIGVMFYMGVTKAQWSWVRNETFTNSFWYPPAAPYRTLFAVGLFLLVIQGLSRFIKDVHFLAKGKEIV